MNEKQLNHWRLRFSSQQRNVAIMIYNIQGKGPTYTLDMRRPCYKEEYDPPPRKFKQFNAEKLFNVVFPLNREKNVSKYVLSCI